MKSPGKRLQVDMLGKRKRKALRIGDACNPGDDRLSEGEKWGAVGPVHKAGVDVHSEDMPGID